MSKRNLVVCDTFEEFSKLTQNYNFEDEDLVCYCLENVTVLYWLSIESIWGQIGFVWDTYENNGHFEVNPIKFDTLPNVPDPQRIKTFNNIFNKIGGQKVIYMGNYKHIDTIPNTGASTLIVYLEDNENINSITMTYNKLKVVGNIDNIELPITKPTFIIDNENKGICKIPYIKSFIKNNAGRVTIDVSGINEYISEYDVTDWPEDNIIKLTNSYSIVGLPSIRFENRKVDNNTSNLYKVIINDKHSYLFNLNIKNNDTILTNGFENEDTFLVILKFNNIDVSTLKFDKLLKNHPVKYCNEKYDDLSFIEEDFDYNPFINLNHRCKYVEAFDTGVIYNKSPYENNNLRGGIWCYNAMVDLRGKVSHNKIDYNVMTENFKTLATSIKYLIDDHTKYASVDVFTQNYETFVNTITTNLNNKRPFKLSWESVTIIIMPNDDEYINDKEELKDIIPELFNKYIYTTKEDFNGSTNVGTIYINDSINKFKGLKYDTLPLYKNINNAVSINTLFVHKDNTFRITPIDDKITINSIIVNDKFPKFIDIPELATPINDPDNYQTNYDIISRYNIPTPMYVGRDEIWIECEQEMVIRYVVTDNSEQFINVNQRSNTHGSKYNYKNHFITSLDKILCIDYGKYSIEDAGLTEETIHIFMSKLLCNPAYMDIPDLRNKGAITMLSNQYAWLTEEEKTHAFKYGWALIEIIKN